MRAHTPKQQPFKSVLDVLRDSQLKITEPRKAVLNILLREHGPFTAEEIYRRIPKRVCDPVTVYRTLTVLEKAGVISRCEFGDGAARYELAAEAHHHHHLICSRCRRVEVLDDCHLDECHRQAFEREAKRKGFSNISHRLEFFGTCLDCAS